MKERRKLRLNKTLYHFISTQVNQTTTVMNNSSANLCNQSSSHFAFQPPSSFDKFTGAVMILIIIISLVGNFMVCYAFIVNSRLRVVTNYFIMNLAISDILTAGLVISFDVDSRLNGATHWKYGPTICTLWTTLYTVSVPTSILTLCVVTIDRYKAISDPISYRAGVSLTTTKAIWLIVGIWTFTLFFAFLPSLTGPPLNVTKAHNLPMCTTTFFCNFNISPGYSVALSVGFFILPSLVMTALYIRMYLIIAKREHLMEESVVSNTTGSDRHMPVRRSQMHYQVKVARHFAIIVLVQVVCWYPFSLGSIVQNLCETCYMYVMTTSGGYFLLTIGYMSCAVNPYLYAYQQRSFRQIFNKIFRVKS